jgi:DNA-directed RNA polymerase I, II, and III subunit RPABC1
MSTIPQLLPIEINAEKQRMIIIENIVKMLVERKLINPKNIQQYVSNIYNNLNDNDVCDINVNKQSQNDSDVYTIVLLIDQKISTITKNSIIGEYLYKNIDKHKIIIVHEITQRATQTIMENFPMIEIFLKDVMMFNIIDSVYVPKHILLSPDEEKKFLTEYDVMKKDIPRIFITDPISKYYNAKIGQIFRIQRPSETTGYTNYYRIVVKEPSFGKSK